MQQDLVSSVVASELELFQGVWRQVACCIDGVKNAEEDYGAKPRVTFEGCEYTVTRADGSVAIKGRFELDPTQTPKAVNWKDTCGADAGTIIPAIYVFEENRFVFCAASEGQSRPTDFSAGSGRIIRIHERVSSFTKRTSHS